jgi:hypothetical protein
MVKTLKKLGIEGIFLNITKVIYDKPIVKIILNGEYTRTISAKVRNDTGMPAFLVPIQYSFEIPNQSNDTGERNTRD